MLRDTRNNCVFVVVDIYADTTAVVFITTRFGVRLGRLLVSFQQIVLGAILPVQARARCFLLGGVLLVPVDLLALALESVVTCGVLLPADARLQLEVGLHVDVDGRRRVSRAHTGAAGVAEAAEVVASGASPGVGRHGQLAEDGLRVLQDGGVQQLVQRHRVVEAVSALSGKPGVVLAVPGEEEWVGRM